MVIVGPEGIGNETSVDSVVAIVVGDMKMRQEYLGTVHGSFLG